MPKFDAKAEAEATSLTLTTQAEIKKQTTALLVGDKGLALRELVSGSSFLRPEIRYSAY